MRIRVRYRLARVAPTAIVRIYARFAQELRRHRRRMIGAATALMASTLVSLLLPWPLKVVFDHVLHPSPTVSETALGSALAGWSAQTVLWAAAAAFLLLTLVKGVLAYWYDVSSKIIAHRFVADVRMRVFSHVQRLPQGYHDYRETGDLMTRLTGDLNLVTDLLVTMLISLSGQLLLVVGMLAVMFVLDSSLALLTFTVVPLFFLAAFRFTGRISTSARRQREEYGRMVTSVQETLSGISVVKGFAQEKAREKLVGRSTDRDTRANVLTTRLEAGYARTIEVIGAFGTALVLFVGAQRVLNGLITAGDLLVFLAYLRALYRPVNQIAKLTTRVSKATARGEKILETLDLQPEVGDREGAVSAAGIVGDIRFDRVSFEYSPGTPVLHDCSCRIPPRRTTLIIGPSGSGKSTIAKLILRLYDPVGGAVVLDGRDVREYRVRSLRKRVTPLSQDVFLFRTSIAENIAFGVRGATREDVVMAARAVGAHEFIELLDSGYDTLVGEGGLTLSGGQRQRIGFARAAIRKSPIMIFDEPATGLDVHAEQTAKDALRRMRDGSTLIVITHRLHFLDLADWVVFVRGGRVVEEGALEALIARRGPFHEFISQERGSTRGQSAEQVGS